MSPLPLYIVVGKEKDGKQRTKYLYELYKNRCKNALCEQIVNTCLANDCMYIGIRLRFTIIVVYIYS